MKYIVIAAIAGGYIESEFDSFHEASIASKVYERSVTSTTTSDHKKPVIKVRIEEVDG